MSPSKSQCNRLVLEQLEDRLTLSVANPGIAFVNGTNGPNSTAPNTLEVMNADGSNQTALVSMPGLRTPHWSPNLLGDSATAYEGALAFNTNYNTSTGRVDELWLTTITVFNSTPQASSPFLLEDTNDPAVQNYLGNLVPTWSPNQNPNVSYTGWIAFGVGTKINVTPVQFNGATVTGPLDQSTVLWSGVPLPPIDGKDAEIGGPAWSSDGNWMAFFEYRYNPLVKNPWQASLWMIPVTWSNGVPSVGPGTAAINLVPEGSFAWITDLEWSRGGSTVAFRGSQSGSTGSPGNLYTVDVSSLQNNPTAPPPAFSLVSAAYSSTSPSWSPDNSSLVFSGQNLNKNKTLSPASIRQVQLATGQQTILASANISLVWPNWRATTLPYSTTTSGSGAAFSAMLIAEGVGNTNTSLLLTSGQPVGVWLALCNSGAAQTVSQTVGFVTPSQVDRAGEVVTASDRANNQNSSPWAGHPASPSADSLAERDRFWTAFGTDLLRSSTEDDLALPTTNSQFAF